MAPRFRTLAKELVDAFAGEGRCEFMSQFAEPYAARVIALLLGIPESEWRKIAEWGTDLGLSLSIAIREELPRIEAALDGLYGFADELIADRRREPKDDFVTRLVQAEQDEDRLSHDELRVSLVLLIFGGMDTTGTSSGWPCRRSSTGPKTGAGSRSGPSLPRRRSRRSCASTPPLPG